MVPFYHYFYGVMHITRYIMTLIYEQIAKISIFRKRKEQTLLKLRE